MSKENLKIVSEEILKLVRNKKSKLVNIEFDNFKKTYRKIFRNVKYRNVQNQKSCELK